MPFVHKTDDLDSIIPKIDGVSEEEVREKFSTNETFKLIAYMDCTDITLQHDTDNQPLVSHIVYFVRDFGNNVLVSKENGICLFSPELSKMPVGVTLNDCTLALARDLMCRLYNVPRDNAEMMRKLCLCSFPTPFGLYYDKDLDSYGAVMQMCVNAEKLDTLGSEYEYKPYEDTDLKDFIEDNFQSIKFKKVGAK